MLAIAPGWELKVDRGPNWLWVKVERPESYSVDTPPLADEVWTQLERHFIYRLVLELEDIEVLDSYLIGQIVMLDRRIRDHDGILRLSGLSSFNREILRTHGLDGRFSIYGNLTEAVMGASPRKPR
jgi:anti-anti-sigma regulatory factor